ncbi:MAG: CBS domain-containing protein [Desulfobaccales bacterium]
MTTREIMDTSFYTLTPQMSISEAVGIFQEAGKEKGRPVFGMMVTDAPHRLVGMLSLYDILLLLRPKHIHIWGEMDDLDISGFLEEACRRAKALRVGDIMTTEVITVTPETHLLMIIDIMIKKHIRRLPVLEDGKILGIIYFSRVFNFLLSRLRD